jgi:hypothetical protein
MTRNTDRYAAFVLRFLGACALFAVIAVFNPMSWMAATHHRLGLGELPTAPIVEYLARSLSAFYFFFGVLSLLAASDIDRYRPIARVLAVTFLLMGVLFVWLGQASEMPGWWPLFQGPPQIGLGALLLFLTRADRRKKEDELEVDRR